MKLISLVAVILVVQTKLSFLDSTFMGNGIQVQGDDYESYNISHHIIKPKIKNVISILFWDVTILYLGCRNIVIPPNKGWTWSNPFAEFLHLCKTGFTYNHIGRFTSQRQGLSKCLSQLNCVAQKLLSYESRVKAMQTDFHNHQKRWKWYINIYLCSPITKFSELYNKFFEMFV